MLELGRKYPLMLIRLSSIVSSGLLNTPCRPTINKIRPIKKPPHPEIATFDIISHIPHPAAGSARINAAMAIFLRLVLALGVSGKVLIVIFGLLRKEWEIPKLLAGVSMFILWGITTAKRLVGGLEKGTCQILL
jgi:hypothetical protein